MLKKLEFILLRLIINIIYKYKYIVNKYKLHFINKSKFK